MWTGKPSTCDFVPLTCGSPGGVLVSGGCWQFGTIKWSLSQETTRPVFTASTRKSLACTPGRHDCATRVSVLERLETGRPGFAFQHRPNIFSSPSRPKCLWNPPHSCIQRILCSFPGERSQNVNLIVQVHPIPRLRICGALPSFSHWTLKCSATYSGDTEFRPRNEDSLSWDSRYFPQSLRTNSGTLNLATTANFMNIFSLFITNHPTSRR